MFQEKEFTELIQELSQKCLKLMTHFKEKPSSIMAMVQQLIEVTEQLQDLNLILLKNPQHILETQQTYWSQAFDLTQSYFNAWSKGEILGLQDARFNHQAWLEQPYFNLLAHHYLLISEHLNALLDKIDYEDQNTAKRLKFFIKQYLSALAPTNFLQTNPQIIAETLNTQGKNLLQGLTHLLSDLEQNPFHFKIKMSDSQTFKLGEQLATTPGKVIFRNDLMELIHYTAQTPTVHSVPLLIIPPWINKYYILDLSPHNSLVRWLVTQGISVFIISWVNPDASFANKSLFDYLEEGARTALVQIKQQMQTARVNTLGFCLGGTLLSMLLAYNKAHQDQTIASATFLASMIDFSEPGDLAVFINEAQMLKLEAHMQEQGYLSGTLMNSSFNTLRANELVWPFFIKNYLRGQNPAPFDILFWNADSTNMPATMHSQYLRWMYLENKLVKPGALCLNNTPIEVDQIDTPCFFLSTEKDHIAPWKSTYLGFQLMKGPKRFVLGGSGHIAGIINSPEVNKYYYKTNETLAVEPEIWLEQAQTHPGSWWPEWLSWLHSYSGPSIAAQSLDSPSAVPLMDAPGSYVFKQSS